MTNLTTTECSAIIRKNFKAAGITASVRSDNYSMGSTIRVRVKSGSLQKARQIAGEFRQVHRDHMTDEILSGANRFVDVEWADEVLEAKMEEVAAGGTREKLEALPPWGASPVELPGGFMVERRDYREFVIWREEGELTEKACSVASTIRTIAQNLLEG